MNVTEALEDGTRHAEKTIDIAQNGPLDWGFGRSFWRIAYYPTGGGEWGGDPVLQVVRVEQMVKCLSPPAPARVVDSGFIESMKPDDWRALRDICDLALSAGGG